MAAVWLIPGTGLNRSGNLGRILEVSLERRMSVCAYPYGSHGSEVL